MRSVLVEGLSRNVTEEHMKEIFGQCGTIEKILLPLSPVTGASIGWARIMFAEEGMAQAAIRFMHHGQLDGNVLECSIVPERRNGSGKGEAGMEQDTSLRSQTHDRHQGIRQSYSRDRSSMRTRN